MNRAFMERFKVWRLAKIQEKKYSRGGRGLSLDVAILHRIFAVAVECDSLSRIPSCSRGVRAILPNTERSRSGASNSSNCVRRPGRFATFLFLRWTGFRGSDAVRITWDEIDFGTQEISRLTQKRKKRVVLPIPKNCFSPSRPNGPDENPKRTNEF